MSFSAPSFWLGGGLESRCVGRVYGADIAPSAPYTQPRQRLSRSIQKLGAENHILQLNIYINKITLLHQVVISHYFMRKMHGQTTLKRNFTYM